MHSEEQNEVKNNLTLSACLIVRNEHNNLQEWIAYHYLTLPLRYLIIAYDPGSSSHPTHTLLKRWNTTDMGMTIEEWTDDNYMRKKYKKAGDSLSQWRYRQNAFMRKCMQVLKRANRTWTVLIDPDEYLVYNRVGMGEPQGFFQKRKDDYVFVHKNNGTLVSQQAMKRLNLPSRNETKTIGEFLMEEQNNYPWANTSCVILPRLRFSRVTSKNKVLYRDMPNGYDPKWFRTLQFFKHVGKISFEDNLKPKPFIDVSRVPYGFLNVPERYRRAFSVHYPIQQCKQVTGVYQAAALLRVNHYKEKMDSYFEKWNHLNSTKKTGEIPTKELRKRSIFTDHDMQGWLKDFVEAVGESKAKMLLEGIEDFEKWYHTHVESKR